MNLYSPLANHILHVINSKIITRSSSISLIPSNWRLITVEKCQYFCCNTSILKIFRISFFRFLGNPPSIDCECEATATDICFEVLMLVSFLLILIYDIVYFCSYALSSSLPRFPWCFLKRFHDVEVAKWTYKCHQPHMKWLFRLLCVGILVARECHTRIYSLLAFI